MMNNRKILFSRIKDVRNKESMKNAIFEIRCDECSFHEIMTTAKNLDIRRSIRLAIKNTNSRLANHFNEFPGHSIGTNIRIIKSFFNGRDVEESKWIWQDVLKFGGNAGGSNN